MGQLTYAQYEEHLPQNLAVLAQRIESHGLFTGIDPGRPWLQPKDAQYQFSDFNPPRDGTSLRSLSVRVLLEPSPDFATCEARWLQLYGLVLDRLLGDGCLGNRIRKVKGYRTLPSDRPSIYRSWVPAYRAFRQDPIKHARAWLLLGIPITLTRLDIVSFFDNIDPSFLISPRFVNRLAIVKRAERDEYIRSTTALLLAYRVYWSKVKALIGIDNPRGVPIGSLTARIVANLALANLDKHVLSLTDVLHYGRYVDDIVVIDKRGAPGELPNNLTHLLPISSTRIKGELTLDPIRLERPGSRFALQLRKLRQERLSGELGLTMLKPIAREFERLSSFREHFLEPRPVDDDFDTGEPTSSAPLLREEDAVVLTKQHVNLVCDKVATAAAMLPPVEAHHFSRRHFQHRLPQLTARWSEFLDVVCRVLATALTSHDFATTHDVFDQITAQLNEMAKRSKGSLKVHWGERRIRFSLACKLLRDWIEAQFEQVVCGSMPFESELGGTSALFRENELNKELLDNARMLVASGLRYSDRERDAAMGTPRVRRSDEWRSSLAEVFDTPKLAQRRELCRKFLTVCRQIHEDPYADLSEVELLLYVEQPTYADILIRWLRTEQDAAEMHLVINALRGTTFAAPTMTLADRALRIEAAEPPADVVRIVLGHLSTDDSWWKASLTAPVLTAVRLERLWRVVNRAIDEARRAARASIPVLFVLPELSLPQRWVREMLDHLLVIGRAVRLSLVVGLEYSRIGDEVFNEVLAFFPRPEIAAAGWIWSKRRPAHHEKCDLQRAGLTFVTRAEAQRFTVVESEHGRFIPLICSELLEVDSRAELLGRVETVIVPAWNPDTTSFEHVINACALELHAFVAVSNNGTFSDARVRGPFKEAWLRDMCRLISRGTNDVVTADLPVARLRQYQDGSAQYQSLSKADPVAYPAWKPPPPGWWRKK